MKILIVEDDPTSRQLLTRLLEDYGSCDTAVDGEEAIKAFGMALQQGERYTLICLDIMMPGMDGHATLEQIRRMEADEGVDGLDGARVIMTTALDDSKNVLRAFRSQCEGYLVKPIDKKKLSEKLESLGMMNGEK